MDVMNSAPSALTTSCLRELPTCKVRIPVRVGGKPVQVVAQSPPMDVWSAPWTFPTGDF